MMPKFPATRLLRTTDREQRQHRPGPGQKIRPARPPAPQQPCARASGAITTMGKKCGRAATARPNNNPPTSSRRSRARIPGRAKNTKPHAKSASEGTRVQHVHRIKKRNRAKPHIGTAAASAAPPAGTPGLGPNARRQTFPTAQRNGEMAQQAQDRRECCGEPRRQQAQP